MSGSTLAPSMPASFLLLATSVSTARSSAAQHQPVRGVVDQLQPPVPVHRLGDVDQQRVGHRVAREPHQRVDDPLGVVPGGAGVPQAQRGQPVRVDVLRRAFQLGEGAIAIRQAVASGWSISSSSVLSDCTISGPPLTVSPLLEDPPVSHAAALVTGAAASSHRQITTWKRSQISATVTAPSGVREGQLPGERDMGQGRLVRVGGARRLGLIGVAAITLLSVGRV